MMPPNQHEHQGARNHSFTPSEDPSNETQKDSHSNVKPPTDPSAENILWTQQLKSTP